MFSQFYRTTEYPNPKCLVCGRLILRGKELATKFALTTKFAPFARGGNRTPNLLLKRVCPTVGVGGHFSGGGYGMMSRKFGIAADNIIDAKLIDANGKIQDRESMGEDLFWAIRGGGGTSFGLIVSWKVKLLDIPEKVTMFNVERTLEQNATQLVYKWQHITDKVDDNLFLRLFVRSSESPFRCGQRTINAFFNTKFIGEVDELHEMQKSFLELGLVKEDCIEMSWIESVVFFARIWKILNQVVGENSGAELQFSPYGGKLSDFSESETPFPHRAGNIFMIHYGVFWAETERSTKHLSWIRNLYEYMARYVSKSPRAAYFNYRDLDLGRNNNRKTSYAQARIWGEKYFKNNFDRLVQVKTKFDPTNFFRNEQSIPPLLS
ncbi:putative DEAD-box ATP-dependent RNA helicase 16-like [Capsicum annuum]|nr:putative DEAD-box ATP-dependent RNA helicase 16-like [Capsicum annuum]